MHKSNQGDGTSCIREPVEYVVTYRYNGRVYRERMDFDPGKWVTLNVEVSPA